MGVACTSERLAGRCLTFELGYVAITFSTILFTSLVKTIYSCKFVKSLRYVLVGQVSVPMKSSGGRRPVGGCAEQNERLGWSNSENSAETLKSLRILGKGTKEKEADSPCAHSLKQLFLTRIGRMADKGADASSELLCVSKRNLSFGPIQQLNQSLDVSSSNG